MAIIFSGFAQGAEITPAQAKALKAQLSEQAKRMEALRKQLADADAKLLEMQRTLGMDSSGQDARRCHYRYQQRRRKNNPPKWPRQPRFSRPPRLKRLPQQSAKAGLSECSRWRRSSNSQVYSRLPVSSLSRLACSTRTRRAIGYPSSAIPSFRL